MIGIFDSGVGGMTVAHAVEEAFPQLPIVYFGDLARTPYGSKSATTILDYSRQNTEFLLKKGASAIIIACNSAASVAAGVVEEEFQVPFFEVIEPAIEGALSASGKGRIGVIGTRATIASGVYERKIKELAPHAKVYSQPCPLLVPLVEEGWIDKRETKMILRRYLQPLKEKQIDTLVLGCTHYPLLRSLIAARIGRRVAIIDSSSGIVRALTDFFDSSRVLEKTLKEGDESRYYFSDITETAAKIAQRIFGRPIIMEKV